MLSSIEVQRFQRQINLPEIGLSGQARLQNAKVLCIGVGGLGSPLCLYLVAGGIGHLGLIDGDCVEVSNLQRQVLYRSVDCGRSKTQAAWQSLHALNPQCHIATYDHYLNEHNVLSILADYDIIVDGSDNFATRYLVNDACVALDKYHVTASVHRFAGQLAVFPGRAGPCYRCLFADPTQLETPNCSEAGVLGTVPGVLGCLQANEVIKLIIGVDTAMLGKLLLVDLRDTAMKSISLSQDPACLACAKQQPFEQLPRPALPVLEGQPLPINLSQLQALIKANQDFQLIDVRTPEQYQHGHLDHAINIPLAQLLQTMHQLDTQQPIIVYCQTQVRSIQACQQLNTLNCISLRYLQGGYQLACL